MTTESMYSYYITQGCRSRSGNCLTNIYKNKYKLLLDNQICAALAILPDQYFICLTNVQLLPTPLLQETHGTRNFCV